jgi:hypothetical protein
MPTLVTFLAKPNSMTWGFDAVRRSLLQRPIVSPDAARGSEDRDRLRQKEATPLGIHE